MRGKHSHFLLKAIYSSLCDYDKIISQNVSDVKENVLHLHLCRSIRIHHTYTIYGSEVDRVTSVTLNTFSCVVGGDTPHPTLKALRRMLGTDLSAHRSRTQKRKSVRREVASHRYPVENIGLIQTYDQTSGISTCAVQAWSVSFVPFWTK